MTRTEFLIQNPKFINTLAIRSGIPYRELEDFRQETILTSLIRADKFDPHKSKITTYAGTFIKRYAIDYLRKLKRVLPTAPSLENPFPDNDFED
ncbi:MAG: sigma factor [Thermoguttaceae bacterium]|nr:sigma factor [Thermoguttaceae bacterium]